MRLFLRQIERFAHINGAQNVATLGREEEEEEVWKMGGFNPRADRARILVADSVELFRRGLHEVLAGDGRFVVAGEASRLEDVPNVYASVRPDAVLVAGNDASWAMTALRNVTQVDARARVLVLITQEASAQVLPFVRAGAQGVLLRDASTSSILGALQDVCDGGSALDARLARMLFESLAGTPAALKREGETELDPRVLSLLSQREREVLSALAQGYRNKQISAELGVSVGTVKTHLRHIFRKLQVEDRTGAVLKALDAGMRKAA